MYTFSNMLRVYTCQSAFILYSDPFPYQILAFEQQDITALLTVQVSMA